MFTVCPKCALTLVVTAADLRVAQGYVRCGRCSSVFNALARLSDERQAGASGDESPAQPSPEPAEPAAEVETDLSPLEQALTRPEELPSPEPSSATEEPIPEDALEFNPATTDVGAVFVEPPPNPQWTAATGSFNAMRAASQAPGTEAPAEPASESRESQVDVEIDTAFLADMLREPAKESEPQRSEPQRSEPQRSEPQRSEPQRSEPQPSEPPGSDAQAVDPQRPESVRRAQPADASPSAAHAPAQASRDSTPGRGAPAPAARARPMPVSASARAAARHGTPHTRPAAEATLKPRLVAASGRAPPPEAAAIQVAEEPDSASPAAAEDADTIATPGRAKRPLDARLGPRTFAAGAALALLLLLAQIVNHYRDELAANPRFNRSLTALYGSLGVQLMPHWDLRAYDVRQLGASADPAGTGLITVRASIKNAGSQAQPLPLLRVTLQDRFGNRIAARDVAPRFYVPHTMPDSSYLAGGQRIDAEMGFVDPGANAVGFEIDACLPARGGGVTCANDLAAR
jgi:predicted Zn finger-like uncharacterized protein